MGLLACGDEASDPPTMRDETVDAAAIGPVLDAAAREGGAEGGAAGTILDAAVGALAIDATAPARPGVLRATGYEPLTSVEATLGMFSDGVASCATRTPPSVGATIYYVAANEPGADNGACDGRSPVDAGNGSCPFENFDAPHIRQLLVNTSNVRIEVRRGLYRLIPADAASESTDAMPFVADGLRVVGAGTSDEERVVLTNYAGETVLFDGEGHIRELVRLSGNYTLVEGLVLVNAGGYNVEVNGGSNHRVRCNRIGWTGSDATKGDGGATDSEFLENEFVDWGSQAIDLTEVRNIRIEGNVFHHPRLADSNATGAKFGATDVLITKNVFHHTRGLSMGGTSSAHDNPVEARRVVARDNEFHDVAGVVAKLYSCEDCEFIDNDVVDTEGGVYFEDQSNAGPSGCPGGCGPSSGGRVAGNRFRRIAPFAGSASEEEANVFVFLATTEAEGFNASGNTYCVPAGTQARFGYGTILDFAGWQAALGTDLDSAVVVDSESPCQGW